MSRFNNKHLASRIQAQNRKRVAHEKATKKAAEKQRKIAEKQRKAAAASREEAAKAAEKAEKQRKYAYQRAGKTQVTVKSQVNKILDTPKSKAEKAYKRVGKTNAPVASTVNKIVEVHRQKRKSDELYNVKRKMLRTAERLRKQAKSVEGTHVSDKAYRKRLQAEARNITKRAERLTARGKTSKQIDKLIAAQTEKLATSSKKVAGVRSNAIFANEMRRAMDRQDTLTFGSGDTARSKILQFFNYYKRDWQSTEGDRFDNVLRAHPGKTLQELYEDMLEQDDDGNSWYTHVADWLGLDYDNIDTTSAEWQARIDSEFAALDSPTQAEISRTWAAMHH